MSSLAVYGRFNSVNMAPSIRIITRVGTLTNVLIIDGVHIKRELHSHKPGGYCSGCCLVKCCLPLSAPIEFEECNISTFDTNEFVLFQLNESEN